MIEKLPPHDIDAEDAVIGSLLIDGETIHKVENTIKPSDFYHEQNQWLFEACLALRGRREAINQITIAQELQREGILEKCGGSAYLSHLISICPTSLDIDYYAAIVRRLSIARQTIVVGNRISSIGQEANPDVNEAMSNISEIVNTFRKSATIFDELVSPNDAANTILDMMEQYLNPPKGMSWGFKTLDDLTSGIFPELIIIGSRPSVGKTQLLLDITENIVSQGYKILFCSAEMMIRSLMERKVARELKVDVHRLRRYAIEDGIVDGLVALAGKVAEQQVHYMPQGVSSQDIYNEALKLKSTIGLDIVFVDYLQILRDCWQSGRESKNVLVGRASKTLKALVNELDIPVVCASQLNRDVEHRTGGQRKPTLADLRESGDIEQDADVVFLLWRDMDNMEASNQLEIKMAKNRQLGDAPAQKLMWVAERHGYYDGYLERERELI